MLRRLVVSLVVSLSVMFFSSTLCAEPFRSQNGVVSITDLGDWTVAQEMGAGGKMDIRLTNPSEPYTMVNIRADRVGRLVNVFHPGFVDALRDKGTRRFTYLVARKVMECGGRRFQAMFSVRTRKRDGTVLPQPIYVQQMMCAMGDRLVLVIYCSTRPDTESHVAFSRLLDGLRFAEGEVEAR